MTESIVINGRSFSVVGGAGKAPTATKPKRSKYGNRKVVVDGVTFDSRREYVRWAELLEHQSEGRIHSLERQPSFVLAASVRLKGDKRAKPAIKYRADFSYVATANAEFVVEDVKSDPTAREAVFRMKRHLMKSVHGIDVRVVK